MYCLTHKAIHLPLYIIAASNETFLSRRRSPFYVMFLCHDAGKPLPTKSLHMPIASRIAKAAIYNFESSSSVKAKEDTHRAYQDLVDFERRVLACNCKLIPD